MATQHLAFAIEETIKDEIRMSCESKYEKDQQTNIELCIENNIYAWNEINTQKEKNLSIVEYCLEFRKPRPYRLVKTCIEQQLTAKSLIKTIPHEYELVVDECTYTEKTIDTVKKGELHQLSHVWHLGCIVENIRHQYGVVISTPFAAD